MLPQTGILIRHLVRCVRRLLIYSRMVLYLVTELRTVDKFIIRHASKLRDMIFQKIVAV